ncbi:hypothetical protein [Actinacidiphila yeochonensis]|uniref:hypothetical protein n=1 Tax=Actinacidiphila yeochonensis TaxID=89050 RepID=UPI0012FEEB60|nr:hypothetical protein [Actinacidiphila yeochonensis]
MGVVLVGGAVGWLVAGRGGGGAQPVRHTAVIPQAFGAYREAKAGDNEWPEYASPNTDVSKGEAYLTYRASGGRAMAIDVKLDPVAYTADDGTRIGPGSDNDTTSLLGISDAGIARSYPGPRQGGEIRCAEDRAAGHTDTVCAWQSKFAEIRYFPMVNHRAIVSATAQNDFRSFLDALVIKPAKS